MTKYERDELYNIILYWVNYFSVDIDNLNRDSIHTISNIGIPYTLRYIEEDMQEYDDLFSSIRKAAEA